MGLLGAVSIFTMPKWQQGVTICWNIVEIHNGRHRMLGVVDASSLADVKRLPPGSVAPPPASARVATALQLMAEGVALGSVYALVALGFVLLYNCASLVNFAQGDLVMIGGYLFATFAPHLGLWLALPAGHRVDGAAVVAVPSRHVRSDREPRGEGLYAVRRDPAIGASIVLKNGARLIWGASTPALAESPFGRGSTEIAGVFVPYHEAGIIVVTIVILGLLYLLFQKTLLGIRLRAVAQDRETAALMGIPVAQMIAATFAGACMLAGHRRTAAAFAPGGIFCAAGNGQHVFAEGVCRVDCGRLRKRAGRDCRRNHSRRGRDARGRVCVAGVSRRLRVRADYRSAGVSSQWSVR